jgi:FtsH-binding integral membrane protein
MNPRYTLHFYIFWAIAIGYAALTFFGRLMSNKGKQLAISLLGVILLFVYVGLPLQKIHDNDFDIVSNNESYINEVVEVANISQKNNDGRVLLDNQIFNY